MAIKIPQHDVAGGLKPIYHLPSCAGNVAGSSHWQEKSVASFLSTGANCCPRVPKRGHLLLVVSLSPPGPTWPWASWWRQVSNRRVSRDPRAPGHPGWGRPFERTSRSVLGGNEHFLMLESFQVEPLGLLFVSCVNRLGFFGVI